jgi:REP element-mobilizing transposase RayT
MNVLPQRSQLPHDTPAWVQIGSTYFITICCQPRGLDQLCNQRVADGIFEAIVFRNTEGHWRAQLFLLMPDHLHALIAFPVDREMTKVIGSFKEITAKKTGAHWQRDFFDHRLRSDESLEEKAGYIRANPVRRGLVTKEDLWPWKWEHDMLNHGGPSGPALPKTVHD